MQSERIADRIRGALWGLLIADAIAMPVHWYYNPRDIVDAFGRIDGYVGAPDYHPSSIMHVANPSAAGRGSSSSSDDDVIGSIILQGRRKYWGGRNVHYHRGMQAGENTLNALCARVLVRTITRTHGVYDGDAFLEEYIAFMTSPDSHNDTYAEGFHRDFFANWKRGTPPRLCAGKEGHDTPSIGGFVMLPPVILAGLPLGQEEAGEQVLDHLELTHRSKSLSAYAKQYASLVRNVVLESVSDSLSETRFRELLLSHCDEDIQSLYNKFKDSSDINVIGRTFSSACYITDSYPSMVYLAYKYAFRFEDAILANANAGGETCHKGAALGALIGAAIGFDALPKHLVDGLAAREDIQNEIEAFIQEVLAHFEAPSSQTEEL